MEREEMLEYIEKKLEAAPDRIVTMVYGLIQGLLGK